MTTTTTGSTDTSSYPPGRVAGRMFHDRIAATPRAEAFRFPAWTGWASLTWAQTAETVKTMAAGLLAEDQAQIAKLRAQRDHIPDVTRVVTFDGQADGEWVLSLAPRGNGGRSRG